MFIIDLTYLVPLEQLDACMPQHLAFLRECYKANLFIASGRKVPRTGGIILAVGRSKAAVEELVKEDPFVKMNLAEATVTEFQTSQVHGAFKKMMASIQ